SVVYPAFLLPELIQNIDKLKQLRIALFDRHSKDQYGDVEEKLKQSAKFSTELEGHKIDVVDTFKMGSTFAADANLIVGEPTFQYLFPDQHPEKIQIGLIKLKPGASAASIQAAVRNLDTKDVQVLTKKNLEEIETNYWKVNSSVGFIFGIGVIVGFVVG